MSSLDAAAAAVATNAEIDPDALTPNEALDPTTPPRPERPGQGPDAEREWEHARAESWQETRLDLLAKIRARRERQEAAGLAVAPLLDEAYLRDPIPPKWFRPFAGESEYREVRKTRSPFAPPIRPKRSKTVQADDGPARDELIPNQRHGRKRARLDYPEDSFQ
jgi:hypothetical protein